MDFNWNYTAHVNIHVTAATDFDETLTISINLASLPMRHGVARARAANVFFRLR